MKSFQFNNFQAKICFKIVFLIKKIDFSLRFNCFSMPNEISGHFPPITRALSFYHAPYHWQNCMFPKQNDIARSKALYPNKKKIQTDAILFLGFLRSKQKKSLFTAWNSLFLLHFWLREHNNLYFLCCVLLFETKQNILIPFKMPIYHFQFGKIFSQEIYRFVYKWEGWKIIFLFFVVNVCF